jgi:hypothetical protein
MAHFSDRLEKLATCVTNTLDFPTRQHAMHQSHRTDTQSK